MSDPVNCCPNPECESTRIYRRTGNSGRYASAADDIEDWRCRECGETFETPDRRDRTPGVYHLNGAASDLDDLDPEDVPALED